MEKIELIVFDSSDKPSRTWLSWANHTAKHFSIKYKWFNDSAVKMSEANPTLGMKRNQAAFMASGAVMINMDNDDVYHPNYVRFVYEHLRNSSLARNRSTHMLGLTAISEAEINPDGSVTLSPLSSDQGHAAVWSWTDEMLRRPYDEGCGFADYGSNRHRSVEPLLSQRVNCSFIALILLVR